MSELQDLYESINPIPENLSRCGDGYCQHVYMLIDPYASGYKDRFEGFKQGLQHQQAKVCSLEEQVKELQEEFAEDERFLKEQIKDKDLKISNLEYQQGMDKELIQTLQCKVDELQKRVNTALKIIESYTDRKPSEKYDIDTEIDAIYDVEQALKGEG